MSRTSFPAARVLIWFRLDYIARDSFQLGTPSGINIPTLIKSCRVVDRALAWSSNDQMEVLRVFKSRWEVHNKCTYLRGGRRCCLFLRTALDYADETAVALSHMFGDALLAANGHLGLSSRVDDPSRYVHLTDTILHQIRQSTNEVDPYVLIVVSWSLGVDVITCRNFQLLEQCSVGWIHANSTVAWGHGSSTPRSNSRIGTSLLLRILFQIPPMIYPFPQEHTMGQLVLMISSSVCIKYIATSKVMGPTSMSIRLIECREYKCLKVFFEP